MGCSHSQFDSFCSSCMLQYEQAESAHWATTEAADQAASANRAANEAQRHRLSAEAHYRRMEKEARRPNPPGAGRPTSGPASSSDNALLWILLLGVAVVVGFGAVAALVATVVGILALVVKVAVVVGIVALGLYVLNRSGHSSQDGRR